MTVKKDWGTTTVSMAAPSLNGGDTYSIEKNKLTLQRKKDIQQITKWDLQEQAAFTFWETRGAKIGYHNGMFFAANEKCKVTKINPEVAKILCEYADVEPDEWDVNTYQANMNSIKLIEEDSLDLLKGIRAEINLLKEEIQERSCRLNVLEQKLAQIESILIANNDSVSGKVSYLK